MLRRLNQRSLQHDSRDDPLLHSIKHELLLLGHVHGLHHTQLATASLPGRVDYPRWAVACSLQHKYERGFLIHGEPYLHSVLPCGLGR